MAQSSISLQKKSISSIAGLPSLVNGFCYLVTTFPSLDTSLASALEVLSLTTETLPFMPTLAPSSGLYSFSVSVTFFPIGSKIYLSKINCTYFGIYKILIKKCYFYFKTSRSKNFEQLCHLKNYLSI